MVFWTIRTCRIIHPPRALGTHALRSTDSSTYGLSRQTRRTGFAWAWLLVHERRRVSPRSAKYCRPDSATQVPEPDADRVADDRQWPLDWPPACDNTDVRREQRWPQSRGTARIS